MQKHLKILAGITVAASFALPVWAEEKPVDADTVMAVVNGKEITLGHMIIARATLPDQYQSLPDQVLFEGILEQLVQQSALSDTVGDTLPKRVLLSLENEKRSLAAGEAVEAILADAITEEAIQAAYDEQYGDIDLEEEFNASHILVETEEEAIALIEALEDGEDFGRLARENSTGPSGPNGGQLGWFGAGMMVPNFEAAAIALEVGAISAPVETRFGWHVIKLNDKRQANIPTLEEVRGSLEVEIRQAAAQQAIREVTDAAAIDISGAEGIDPALLKDLSLVE